MDGIYTRLYSWMFCPWALHEKTKTMKIRTDFVTNSSSSSFVISKYYITPWQQQLIRDHIENAKSMDNIDYKREEDSWVIEEDELTISGNTWMDNFDMRQFLENIHIPSGRIEWRD